MLETLTFITGNPGKAEQLGRYLDFPVVHKKVDLVEIQSLDLGEVVRHKAQEAYSVIQGPVIVEDTSLQFLALGRLPGTFIKWFSEELGNDGLCTLLDSYADRSALAEVQFALHDGKEVMLFDGQVRGAIAEEPRGERGFGWDPIFIPDGSTKTYGEMADEEQKATSMRKIALEKLEAYLKRAK